MPFPPFTQSHAVLTSYPPTCRPHLSPTQLQCINLNSRSLQFEDIKSKISDLPRTYSHVVATSHLLNFSSHPTVSKRELSATTTLTRESVGNARATCFVHFRCPLFSFLLFFCVICSLFFFFVCSSFSFLLFFMFFSAHIRPYSSGKCQVRRL
jgi:hypothetical protein